MVQLLITTAGHASRANLFSMSYTTAYLLCIAAFIFAVVCSINVKSTFNKYARIASRRGVTAAQAARQILDRNGLYYVQVQRIAGNLTDNYNPKTNIVSLSDSVYDSSSLAAIGVAAHAATLSSMPPGMSRTRYARRCSQSRGLAPRCISTCSCWVLFSALSRLWTSV